LDSRERARPLPGFGGDAEERGSSEPAGVRENRIRLLNEVASEGVKILKQSERHLPDTVERLLPSTKKQLNDLMQRALAQWRKATEGVDNVG